ncbi:MAG: HNH endonuclease [Christensenellales bacterium]
MSFSKKKREAVYAKYDGHCAYCGRAIEIKDMQVDHFKPQRAWNAEDAGTDDISNLMPSCRMCNHYKRANSLETFRRYIAEIPRKLRENYIYKVGVVYGMSLSKRNRSRFTLRWRTRHDQKTRKKDPHGYRHEPEP